MGGVKKIIFLTGTRADFGKLKSLIEISRKESGFEVHIFVTGMHLLKEYGETVIEIKKCGYDNIFEFHNHSSEKSMDISLARTVEGFSSYINEIKPDLIVVHGDRLEAMSGAIVGAFNNILVAHIEGGEISGTIDELIRHSVSKLSHIHFVANESAKKRLIQMGEHNDSVYVIGSPDVDLMMSKDLPSIDIVKEYYGIDFEEFGIFMFHPVTTEIDQLESYCKNVIDAAIESNKKFVAIYPNNDLGSAIILKEFKKLKENDNFKVYPSIRFEYFLVLLKNSQFIYGNSSAGIREAPYYSLPTINIGTRQNNRSNSDSIINTSYEKENILEGLEKVSAMNVEINETFGEGNSDKQFIKCLNDEKFWDTSKQKMFIDIK